jgi:zeaxanthin glucosyltransferase
VRGKCRVQSLEALSMGVPLVAIPIANDQPGVATRLAWTGAGLFIRPKKLTAAKPRELVRRVLTEPSFKQSAERL